MPSIYHNSIKFSYEEIVFLRYYNAFKHFQGENSGHKYYRNAITEILDYPDE